MMTPFNSVPHRGGGGGNSVRQVQGTLHVKGPLGNDKGWGGVTYRIKGTGYPELYIHPMQFKFGDTVGGVS